MATRRFSHLDDWVLKDGNIGINTSSPSSRIDIGTGRLICDNLDTTGVSTFTSLQGFNKSVSNRVSSSGGRTLSGEIIIDSGQTMTVSSGSTTGQGYVGSLKVSNSFIPPIGVTADRPISPNSGSLFYNKDLKTIEYWDGKFWRQVDNTTRSGRGVMGGGGEPGTSPYNGASNKIDYINIPSLGNSTRFGTLSLDTRHVTAVGNEIRGIFYLGYTEPGTHNNVLDYITIASEGNAIDFGDRATQGYAAGSCSSSTRGIWAGGQAPSGAINSINYVEIMTKGNAIDFGDLTTTKSNIQQNINSPTRGLFGGGSTPTYTSTIDTIILSSKGNAIKFGDLNHTGTAIGGASNSVRGFFAGGYTTQVIREMQHITIASGGNTIYFGDLQRTGSYHKCLSSQTRGVITSGSPSIDTRMQYIEIASTGDSQFFGDLGYKSYDAGTLSDCHGGLGGY